MKNLDKKVLLSTTWIVLTVNYIFCDVFTLMHAPDLKMILQGKAGDLEMTQEFLLSFGIIMEIPMLMILLSRVLPFRINRVLNIVFGIFLGFVQGWSMTVGDNTLHYYFFSVVEVSLALSIAWLAIRWKKID